MFSYTPDEPARREIEAMLDLSALRKARFEGRLSPLGREDWHLDARLGATAVQPCVVTLAPVTTRIDAVVTRHYLADPGPEPSENEVEMPEDDTVEALPETLDLQALFAEALALELPDYPRVDDASLGDAVFTEPGKAAMTDDDAKPFAALKALKSGDAD